MRIFSSLGCLLFAFIPLVTPAFSQPIPAAEASLPPLKIGLIKNFGNADTVLLSCNSSFQIQDTQSGATLLHGAAGTVYCVTRGSDGLTLSRSVVGGDNHRLSESLPVSVVPNGNGILEIARTNIVDPSPDLSQKVPWHRYAGSLTIQPTNDNSLLVINNVCLEDYLKGVVPAEIGPDAPTQALEAQAIAARTYALKNLGKFAAQGFDLDDTTRCEGYLGVNGETDTVDAAVDATCGIVLAWHSSLIEAFYSTDSGGMTACDPAFPYLQAVRDAPSPDGPDYGADSRYHVWDLTLTPKQMQEKFDTDPRSRVGDFASLTLNGYDLSGRITTATITGTDGTVKTVAGPVLRAIIGYDTLRSTLVTMNCLQNGDYQFSGRGWGHGLGMSQDGAIAMASAPYSCSYRKILTHYYPGAALVEIGSHSLNLAGPIASRVQIPQTEFPHGA